MARAAAKLADYNAKRDFTRTREPRGEVAKAGSHIFMVQKHAATRLHWDFRLELDGVLLSWAVTRGPSDNPEDKRLAVRTEDHPLGYATFEGTIPKGEYGGGTVMLWDRGQWRPCGDPHAMLAAGKLHFVLTGERMHGEWILIRLKPEGKRENWLLRKVEDEFANQTDLVGVYDTSVVSKRAMDAIADAGEAVWTADGEVNPPAFRPPMLATLVDAPPAGNGWIHETKYDGYRVLLSVAGGKAVAHTRNGNDWTEKFGDVVTAAAKLPCRSALLDGELVALDADGKPGFSALQAALKGGGPLVAFVFDLLELDGEDLAKRSLLDRKARLATLLEGVAPPLHYAEHVRGGGERMFAALCQAGYEGVVSKKADSRYVAGRSGQWLKSKCTHRQEFVIGGWSRSDKGRGFASLLLGVRDKDGLRYAGRVGTGFNTRVIQDLSERFEALAVDESPFAGKLAAAGRRGAHFVRPELVCEVAFTEWTADHHLRHPSFLGLREDKPAGEVVEETPAEPPGRAKSAPKLNTTEPKGDDFEGVHISSPERAVFPELGLTKRALAAYYAAVAEPMLEHLGGRPVSLVRCPQGRGKQCFFQKHDSGMFGGQLPIVEITESDGAVEPYLHIDDAHQLLVAVQMGTIEFHGWGSRVADIERPDRLVFDLDPDDGLDWNEVKSAALLIRDRLTAAGLGSAPLLSGGKGVHVVAPLVPRAEWPEVKAWARAFCDALAAEMPDRFTATMSKARRKGRVFLDYLRNQRGATAVMPFSVRARPNAPVAITISWAQLAASTAPGGWSAADPAAVLRQGRKRWPGVEARPLPKG